MSKHTPGPWFVSDRPHGYGCEVSRGSPGGQVIVWTFHDWLALDEQQANARLIAAAPELLGALKGMVEWQAGIQELVPDAIWSRVQSAIAKAEGR